MMGTHWEQGEKKQEKKIPGLLLQKIKTWTPHECMLRGFFSLAA
jgi:hypothetical protein